MADLIADFERHLHHLGRAQATISTYMDMLRRLDRQLPHGLAAACADELLDFIYDQRHSPATRALYRAAVRAFFRWASDPDDGVLDFDPSAYLPRVRVPDGAPRPPELEQLHDILSRARNPYRLWFILAAGAGLRCIEIARLDREHVTPRSIWVQGKGGRTRMVDTHPAVWAAVRDLPPGPVARIGGKRATRKQISMNGNIYLRRLGVPVTMHQLRHFFVTWSYRAGGEFVARQLAGHASTATTQRYALVASDATAAAVAAVPVPVTGAVAAGAGAAV